MDELQKISSSADLFIHCAFIEVEGLSLMEAVQLGIVPIIAKAKLSATSMFAKSDESIYKAKNPSDLASKIDYWLSNKELRIKEAEKYKNMAKDYDIEKSIDLLEVMFNDAYNK
jgi:glycosyltransferase involved in cell wall biosynthesis